MKRYDVLNKIIHKEKYRSYLEIGYGTGFNYDKIRIDKKTAIDIGYGVEDKTKCFIGTSSSFFKKNKGIVFDVIFIDGSHLFEDVLVDFYISLNHLSENGTIVLHDCNPPTKDYQERKQVFGCPGWTGDVWKAFLYLKTNRKDLNMFVVDTDYGCGVIKRINGDSIGLDWNKSNFKYAAVAKFVRMPFIVRISTWIFRIKNNYDNLDKNKKTLLELKSTEEFEELYQ